MIFERVCGALGCIAEMHVWRYELNLSLPNVFDDAFVIGADLIVEDLEVQYMAACSEMSHDRIVGSEAVLVGLYFERRLENCIGVSVVGNRYVLIDTTGDDREAISAVILELA